MNFGVTRHIRLGWGGRKVEPGNIVLRIPGKLGEATVAVAAAIFVVHGTGLFSAFLACPEFCEDMRELDAVESFAGRPATILIAGSEFHVTCGTVTTSAAAGWDAVVVCGFAGPGWEPPA